MCVCFFFVAFWFCFIVQIAKKYYGTDKLYVFNGLHNDPDGPTFEERDQDRPPMATLFDTFVAVRKRNRRRWLCACFVFSGRFCFSDVPN